MKILIADKFQEAGIEKLRAAGCDVAFFPDTNKDQMQSVVAQNTPKILIVRGTKVSSEAIAASESLALIVRAGAGYDSIDVAEASRRGISVANCPGKNAVAVAELAWGLILACDRRVPDQTMDLRQKAWNKKEYSKAKGLKGRTLGVIGTGKIGLEVAKRGIAFDMNVVAWSRSLDQAKAHSLGVGFCSSLSDLAKQCDVVSVNVAANAETANLIDEAFISHMKDGAYFVNTSRGSVVDSAALSKGIREKGIRAGLDVYANEPGSGVAEFEDEIIALPGVYGTHHVGASTDQAQAAIAEEAVRVIVQFIETGNVENCVNLATQTPAKCLLTVRHKNLPGVLAHVFEVVGEAEINVEEMENVIYDGAEAANAKIQLSDALLPEHLDKIKTNANILSLELSKLD